MPKRRSPYKEKIEYFSSPYFGVCTFAEGEGQVSETGDTITKAALVMVEGHHRDSNNKDHFFDASRIQRIVNNTNQWLAQGGRVPWQRDHKKDQLNNIGDLEGTLEVRRITQADLPNPRLTDLVGKMGAFTKALVGKGKDVVEQVLAGRIKTLSPGIDIENDLIREVSATPTPAIVGLSTFKKAEAKFALTLAEAEAEEEDLDQFKEELHSLVDAIADTAESIMAASEEELQGASPEDLLFQLVQDSSDRLAGMLGLGDAASPPVANPNYQYNPYQQPGMPAAPVPGYLQKQQGMGMARMSRVEQYANFSLEGIERAEFVSFPSMPRPSFGQRKKKEGSALGTATKVAGAAGLAGAGAAAVRYGGSAARAGMRGAKVGMGAAQKAGAGRIGSAAMAGGAGLKAAAGSVGRGMRRDASKLGAAAASGMGAARGMAGGAKKAIGKGLLGAAKRMLR